MIKQKHYLLYNLSLLLCAMITSYLFESSITAALTTKYQASVFVRHWTKTSSFGRSVAQSRYPLAPCISLFSSMMENSSQHEHGNSVDVEEHQPPVHLVEGLCAVYKPTDWTSQDVVSCIRGMLERDARSRGVTLSKRSSRRGKRKIKVGHGGTLDPLAEGVLVLGVGSGTKELNDYLSGGKSYLAGGKFGFETNTLDLEGNVTKTALFDHITHESVQNILGKFEGEISQVPPIFSAIRKNGKRLYEQARQGATVQDIDIEPRQVEVYNIEYIPNELPSFDLSVQCGGGTYIRSLIRDIGYELKSVATMTKLVRTRQGPFLLEDAISREDWNPETIYAAIEKNNVRMSLEAEFDN